MSALTIAQVLEGAVGLIERDGWTQGSFGSGCHCVRGAICRADNISPTLHESRAEKTLADCIGGDYLMAGALLVVWNDAPERTKAEVVAKLREAAALAREQGK